MLDQLLGRAELKEAVAELEAERERLERQLEAETERRRAAVRDKQAAEERVNQLEDRIAGLEGELDRHRDEDAELSFVSVQTLGYREASTVLETLGSVRTPAEGALTAVVHDSVPDEVGELLGERSALVGRAAPCVVCADDRHLVRVALTPPRLPTASVSWADTFDLERGWFVPTGRFTFALIRADRFALGTYEGETLGDVETIETDVQASHSKGGFSQSRFERRRDEQIAEHLDRCRATIDARESGPLILVGDRRMLTRLDVDPVATATVDASGPPREALEDAFVAFWQTRLYVL